MKFEDKIKDVLENLDEDIQIPQTMGAPAANNPAQVAGQPQTGQQPQGQQQELTADDMLNWALSQDPKTTEQFAKLQGEEKFQAIADAMSQANNPQGQPNAQMNPVAASNANQTTSASNASTNTSGTMGAGSTQV